MDIAELTNLTNIINIAIEKLVGKDADRYAVIPVEAWYDVDAQHGSKTEKKDAWSEGVSFKEAVTRCGTKEALCKAVSDGRVISEGGNGNRAIKVYDCTNPKPETKEYWAEVAEQYWRLKRQKKDMQPENVTINQMANPMKRHAAAGGRRAMEFYIHTYKINLKFICIESL